MRSPLKQALILCGFSCGGMLWGQTLTASQTLSVGLSAIGKVVSAPGTLTFAATPFSAFTVSGTLNLRIRTAPASSGTLTVRASADFTPTGGPSISSGALTYTCGSSYGTACTGSVTAQTSGQTSFVSYPASACTGGGGSCSSSDPTSASIFFSVADLVSYKTGNYSAAVIFTISAI